MAEAFAGVFFDLVGTLIRSRQPIGEQYASCAGRHGAPADPARMGAAFRHAMHDAPPMRFRDGADVASGDGADVASGDGTDVASAARASLISAARASLLSVARASLPADIEAAERQWWKALVRSVVDESGIGVALQGERFEAFFADLYDHFTTADAWETYPDALPTLQALSSRGLVVGLITNYDTRVYRVLDALDLSTWLDSVTIPALAGTSKPDPAIFAHALKAHGMTAADAIYVGDELSDDYQGAEGAGMRAVLIDREGRHKGAALRTIGSLRELTIDEW